jgi:hypothetical protein
VESWSHFWWRCASLHSQQLLQIVFFQFPHKKCISHFSGGQSGQNRCFFMKGPPRAVCKTSPLYFSWVGDLAGVSHPGG